MIFHDKKFGWILLALLISMGAGGASITLTAPVSAVEVSEGDDFFTDVLNDPVDFSQRRDIRWEEHFEENTTGVQNGIWSGIYNGNTAGGNGAYVFPHFQGIPGALNAGKTGVNYPIDTSKYRYVSLMNRVSQRTVRRMYWTRDGNWPNGDYKTKGTDGTFQTGSATENDGYQTDSTWIIHDADTWVIYLIDLRNKTEWTDANVTGIRFDASPQADAGTKLEYRFFRVIDPDSSETLTVSWNTDGAPSGAKVNIYVDTDNGGYDGAFLTRAGADAGSFSFPAAALPPGTYYLYLKLFDNVDNDTELAASAYSAAVTVNGKGRVEIVSPSRTSGPDYAAEIMGNPWDMDAQTDLANLSKPDNQKCFVDEQFVNDTFQATAVIVGDAPHSDVQLWMSTDPEIPIDTARYRYFTYTLEADPTYYGNIKDKVSRGWVTRVIWWTDGLSTDGEQTNDNILYEGIHSYTIDLKTVEIEPDSSLSGTRWTDKPTVANLRLDPLETSNDEGTGFTLHDVKLTADPEPVNHKFEAVVNLEDPEGEALDVAYYLDTDAKGFDGTYLGRKTYAETTGSFQFETCRLEAGDYYLYVIITDEFGNTTRRYADAPIHIEAAAPDACTQVSRVPINYLLM